MRTRPVDGGVPSQLLQHERTAARIPCHAGFVVGRERRVDRKQVADEADGFVLRHRLERHVSPPVPARPVEERLEQRIAGRLFAAKAQQREQGRRTRMLKQYLEQDGAVSVGPLQVVDPDDQRSILRQPAQQLPQRLECPAPKS